MRFVGAISVQIEFSTPQSVAYVSSNVKILWHVSIVKSVQIRVEQDVPVTGSEFQRHLSSNFRQASLSLSASEHYVIFEQEDPYQTQSPSNPP